MVAARRYVPDRGDLIWLDFTPQAGHEQRGTRPALVLSPAAYNGRVGLVIVCPVTSKVKGMPFEVPVSTAGLNVDGVVLTDHVKSLDWQTRRARFIERAPIAIVEDVVAKFDALLHPNEPERLTRAVP